MVYNERRRHMYLQKMEKLQKSPSKSSFAFLAQIAWGQEIKEGEPPGDYTHL